MVAPEQKANWRAHEDEVRAVLEEHGGALRVLDRRGYRRVEGVELVADVLAEVRIAGIDWVVNFECKAIGRPIERAVLELHGSRIAGAQHLGGVVVHTSRLQASGHRFVPRGYYLRGTTVDELRLELTNGSFVRELLVAFLDAMGRPSGISSLLQDMVDAGVDADSRWRSRAFNRARWRANELGDGWMRYGDRNQHVLRQILGYDGLAQLHSPGFRHGGLWSAAAVVRGMDVETVEHFIKQTYLVMVGPSDRATKSSVAYLLRHAPAEIVRHVFCRADEVLRAASQGFVGDDAAMTRHNFAYALACAGDPVGVDYFANLPACREDLAALRRDNLEINRGAPEIWFVSMAEKQAGRHAREHWARRWSDEVVRLFREDLTRYE